MLFGAGRAKAVAELGFGHIHHQSARTAHGLSLASKKGDRRRQYTGIPKISAEGGGGSTRGRIFHHPAHRKGIASMKQGRHLPPDQLQGGEVL